MPAPKWDARRRQKRACVKLIDVPDGKILPTPSANTYTPFCFCASKVSHGIFRPLGAWLWVWPLTVLNLPKPVSWKTAVVKKASHPFGFGKQGVLTEKNYLSPLGFGKTHRHHPCLPEGQTQALQIPILCLINDPLNHWFPLINQNKSLVHQILVKGFYSHRSLNFVHPLSESAHSLPQQPSWE